MMGWQNGLDEAIARMRQHLSGSAPIKFDARDREALAFILERVATPPVVFAVANSTYMDDECAGLYRTEDAARKKADELSGMWSVEEWSVR